MVHEMTSTRPQLPDFIIIGAMKAGTTTLYHYLSEHPEIGMSEEKETDFFVEEKNYRLGLEWYRNQFKPGFSCYGEASPNYAKARDFPGVPERIAATIPKCKFIYLVRDPVERFISQYNHAYLTGMDIPEPEELYGQHEWFHILDASLYHRQLTEYLKYVPLESILVIALESFVQSPVASLKRITEFLGVSERQNWEWTKNANSSRELARIPRWVLRLRFAPGVGGVLRRVPKSFVQTLRSKVAYGRARELRAFNSALRESIANAVADDAQRLRMLTGQRFDAWSV